LTVRPVPDDLVATVAGQAILADRVDRRLADLRRGPRARHIPPDGAGGSGDLRRWVAQELVMEAVLVHEAHAAGIADIARLVARVTADVRVPEADVRAYYDRNADLYHHPEARTVLHVVVRDQAVAREAAARLAGAGPAGPAESEVVRRGDLAGPLEEAIFGAGIGAVVGPIRTELGWHVARIEAVAAAFLTPFGEARATIEDELLVAARARAFDEWLEGRRAALVVVEPAFEHPGHPSHGLASHRH
jgi:[acyl-carrier-protein] S-malonyltransferase